MASGERLYESVCVFLQSGRTFTFRDVSVACDNETFLILEYSSMKAGKSKRALLQKSAIVGWSLTG